MHDRGPRDEQGTPRPQIGNDIHGRNGSRGVAVDGADAEGTQAVQGHIDRVLADGLVDHVDALAARRLAADLCEVVTIAHCMVGAQVPDDLQFLA